MLDFLLSPQFPRYALPAFAVLTPVVAFLLRRFRPLTFPRRGTLIFAALGPFVGLLWLFHGWVLATVGFDSIFSALIVMGTGAIVGVAAGFWAAGDDRP